MDGFPYCKRLSLLRLQRKVEFSVHGVYQKWALVASNAFNKDPEQQYFVLPRGRCITRGVLIGSFAMPIDALHHVFPLSIYQAVELTMAATYCFSTCLFGEIVWEWISETEKRPTPGENLYFAFVRRNVEMTKEYNCSIC